MPFTPDDEERLCRNFTFIWPCCIVTNFFIIKPTRLTNIPNLFWHETLQVSDSSSAHHQEFIQCTLGTGICHTGLKTAVFKLVLPRVHWINSWWWAEELSETCRVSCQNKFGKLVSLVDFIIKKPCRKFVWKRKRWTLPSVVMFCNSPSSETL
jgi:hypothetical protein